MLALEHLGISASEALMVGDRPERDGGAVHAGIRTLLLLGDEREIRPGIKVSRNTVRRLMAYAAGVALFPFLEPYASRKIFQR